MAAVLWLTLTGVAPIVIGHRGASGERPEHTLASYSQAIAGGADFIEPDLVSTSDGILVARHENEISGTTNVSDHPEFSARHTTKIIDGHDVTGWFTEDFTLAELKTLRARERLPNLRPANTAYDGQFEIPTFAEIIALAKAAPRQIGLYPETKHPGYFATIGLPLEPALLAALTAAGYTKRSDPVFIQSFETANLKALRQQTDLSLIQLVDSGTSPDGQSYETMMTPAGLRQVATYADGIGPNKDRIIPRDAAGKLLAPTSLIADAHAAKLKVHPWTFRSENDFLPLDFRSTGGPAAHGDAMSEYHLFYSLGVDGVFSDYPAAAVAARGAINAAAQDAAK